MQKSIREGLLTPKRRDFLKLGAVGGGAGLISSRALDASGADIRPPYTVPYLEALPVYRPKAPVVLSPPPQEYPHPDEAGREPHQAWNRFPYQKTYSIIVKQGMHSFHPHLPTQVIWGYDGKLPGPTLVGRMGEPVIVRYYNRLPRDVNSFGSPEISTHLHNGHSASESDGFAGNYFSATVAGPTLTRPGKYYDCHYPNAYAGTDRWPESAGDYREGLGTLWYHDHLLDFTVLPFTAAHLGAVHHHGRQGVENIAVGSFGAHLATLDPAVDDLPQHLHGGLHDPVEDHAMEALSLRRVALVNHRAKRETGAGEHRVTGQQTQHQEVLTDASLIRSRVELWQPGTQGVGDEILLGRPTPVDRGLAGLGTGGDTLHRQAVPADGAELVEGGVEDRAFEYRTAAAGGSLSGGIRPAGGNHLTLSNEQRKRAFGGWGTRRTATQGDVPTDDVTSERLRSLSGTHYR